MTWNQSDVDAAIASNPDTAEAQKRGSKGLVSPTIPLSPAKGKGVKSQAQKITVSELDWQATVIDLAHALGWKVAYFRKARVNINGKETYRTPVGADGAGWPDLVLVRCRAGRRQIIHAELKSETGVVSLEQREWLNLLGGHLWRPSDYETVQSLLK